MLGYKNSLLGTLPSQYETPPGTGRPAGPLQPPQASPPPAPAALTAPHASSHSASHAPTQPPPRLPHTEAGRAHRPRPPRRDRPAATPAAPPRRAGPGVRRRGGRREAKRPAERTDAAGTQCAQALPPRREERDPRLGPMRPRPERDFLRGSPRRGEPRRSGGDT